MDGIHLNLPKMLRNSVFVIRGLWSRFEALKPILISHYRSQYVILFLVRNQKLQLHEKL